MTLKNLTFRASLCSMVWIERLFEVLEEKAVLYTGFKAFLKILQAASKFLRGSFISLFFSASGSALTKMKFHFLPRHLNFG